MKIHVTFSEAYPGDTKQRGVTATLNLPMHKINRDMLDSAVHSAAAKAIRYAESVYFPGELRRKSIKKSHTS